MADTIAAHQLGGFKIPGGALRKCRDCNATQNLINAKVISFHYLLDLLNSVLPFQFREEYFTLRTPSNYDRDCDRLENSTIPEYDSTTYGVNYRSPLNDIKFFHVANDQIPQDIMHILFEGIIPLEMKLLLQSLIWEKAYFTLHFLNERIASFSYGKAEYRNKPPKDLEKARIESQGSTMHLSGISVSIA